MVIISLHNNLARIFPIVFLLIGLNNLPIQDSDLNHWSPQMRIPGYDDDTVPPHLIADQNNTVHAFTSQSVGDENPQVAIIYNQWNLSQGWTDPVDILLSPINQAHIMNVRLDSSGIMHLIFFGGNNLSANIYYTWAPGMNAGNAFAWAKPVLIGADAIAPSSADLISDDSGNLFVIYSGNLQGKGIYYIRSFDNGNAWSDPYPIFLTFDDELIPAALKLYYHLSGKIHAVWTIYNIRGNSISSHYTNFDADKEEWRRPIEIDEGIGIGINYPLIFEHSNELFLVYTNGIPPTGVPPAIWMRRSLDDGISWSTPVRPFPAHVGVNGNMSIVKDGTETLHLFFAQRTGFGNQPIHGLWHSIWQGKYWSTPESVVSGPPNRDRFAGNEGFDPYDALAVSSQGNILLVTWRTDPGAAHNGVWYSYLLLGLPEMPTEPLPLPSGEKQEDQTTPDLLQFSPNPIVQDSQPEGHNQQSAELYITNPSAPLIAGSIAVLLSILALVIGYYIFLRNR